jgi:effector-binding domain-containing protein
MLKLSGPPDSGGRKAYYRRKHTQMITEPKIEHRNEQPYMGIRAQVAMQELGKVLPPLLGEVYGWLASKSLKPAGAPLWRYRIIDMAAKLEIDVAVPVAATVTGDNRIVADILPAGRYATLIYTGPYEGLIQATGDLLAWAEKKGIVWDKQPAGPKSEAWRARVENYLTDPAKEPDPAKWETELAFKLADDQRAS